MKPDNKSLGTDKISSLLIKLAAPAILAQIVNLLYNVVDRMYIGHIAEIGNTALTGVGVCLPLITIVAAFAALISMGGAPRASIALGKGDTPLAEKILGNCFILQIITSIILTAFLLIFSRDLLMIFGASNNTIGYAMDYISVYAIGTIFVQLTLGMNAFITAQGFTKVSMLTIIIGAVCNIIFDPIFIFLFNMGVKGAALATIISQAISAIWIICFLSSKKTILHIKRENFPLKLKVILPCLFLGLSPFIMQFTESILFLSFNSSLYKYGGDLAVGAMTILSATMQFSMLPLHGLTQGSQPIISYNYGAKNTDRVKQCFRYLLISCCLYSITLWALIMLFPSVFISIFTDNADLMEYSIHAIRIYMLMTGIFGIQIACQQTFVAIGNAKTSLFLALLRKIFLLIPLIYILPILFTENKCDSIFMAEPIADFIAVTTTSIMFFFSFRKSLKKIEKEKDITVCPSD